MTNVNTRWVILRKGVAWVDGECFLNPDHATNMFRNGPTTIVQFFQRLNVRPLDPIDRIELIDYDGSIIDAYECSGDWNWTRKGNA